MVLLNSAELVHSAHAARLRFSEALRTLDEPNTGFSNSFNSAVEQTQPSAVAAFAETADDRIDAVEYGADVYQMFDFVRTFRALRMAANTPVAGPSFGAVSATGVNISHGYQRGYALMLRESGVISSDVGLRAYLALSRSTEMLFYGDVAASTIDGTGATIVLSYFLDIRARNQFQDWVSNFAPNISAEDYAFLAPSFFTGEAPIQELMDSTLDGIPLSVEGQPPELHRLITLTNTYRNNSSNLEGVSLEYAGVVAEQTEMEARASFEVEIAAEIEALLSNPETAQIVLTIMPIEERLAYVHVLAESEPLVREARHAFERANDALRSHMDTLGYLEGVDPRYDELVRDLGDARETLETVYTVALSDSYPEIGLYLQERSDSLTGWNVFLESDDAIRENPNLLDTYILARLFPEAPIPQPDSRPDPSNQDLIQEDSGGPMLLSELRSGQPSNF